MIGTRPGFGPRDDSRRGVTIYSRPGCHLCDDMKAVTVRAAASMGLTIEEVDVTGDADLEARYGAEVPVLVVDGRKVAKYRVSEARLIKILSGQDPGRQST